MPPPRLAALTTRLGADTRLAWAALAALTLLFAALCLHGLTAKPLWNDEAFSFFVAWRDLGHTLHMMRQDTQPPAYYVALTGWLGLGHGPAMLRGLSVLAMLLVVPLLFDTARRLFGAPAALLAVVLFVLAPDAVAWAQKARPYALQTLFVAVGFWGFVRIWTAVSPRPWVGWIAYVVGGGLAVLAQYPGVFFLLACNVAMAVRIFGSWRTERRLLWPWVIAQLGLVLVWLPWVPDGVPQVLGNLTPGEIAAKHTMFLIDRAWLINILTGLLAVPYLWRGQPPFLALCAVLGIAGIVALARAERRGLPVLAAVVVPVGVCVLAWALAHPVFGYVIYTFVWLHVPYAMLLAAGLFSLRPRFLGAGAAVLLVLGDLWGLANYEAASPPPVDRVAALIAAGIQPGDGVLLSTTQATRWALAYYLGPPYAGRLDGLDVADFSAEGWPIATPGQALKDRRLWVVLPDGETLPFPPADLAPAMAQAVHQRFGNVTVDRYDRK